MQDDLRALARRLLEEGRVSVVIGYAAGSLPDTARPVFVRRPEDADRLIFNAHCYHNLSVYLTRAEVKEMGCVAIVAKGCDVKGIIGLLQEHQINRDNVIVVGVCCDGVGEPRRFKCEHCDVHTPSLYDHLVGETRGTNVVDLEALWARTSELDAMTPDERWAFWQEQFSRCIKCYACRQVCPLCYCTTCITDKNQPQWIETSAHPRGNLAWNLIRALHLAGRCIGCEECSRVCPAGIPLHLLNDRAAREIFERFGYRAGYDVESPPPLAVYRTEDAGEFIR